MGIWVTTTRLGALCLELQLHHEASLLHRIS
jgi:hypothetical protein